MPNSKLPVARFAYKDLIKKGVTKYVARPINLVVTFRGTGMIDVFDQPAWAHVAFLDFDIDRDIHLDSAFGVPVIGLPFTSDLGRELGVSLQGFEDLRRYHHYGFFIDEGYRNRGVQGVWNLDELLMAIALEYAEDHGPASFRIAPTGDTEPYYRRKFNAYTVPDKSGTKTLAVRLGDNRGPLPHVRIIRSTGRKTILEVPQTPDPWWPFSAR